MLAIGRGASKKIEDQISTMGSNLLIILPGATTSGGVRTGSGGVPTLTLKDAEAIENGIIQNPYRQFYLSLDIDLTKITTKSKMIFHALKRTNCIVA